MSHRIRDSRNLNLRRKAYRPLVERLEDRLPPSDAVFAGLLAQGFLAGRAAGLVPAGVTAAPPGPARRLAEPAPFELPADLEWLGNRAAPARPIASAPAELSTQHSVLSTQRLGRIRSSARPRIPRRRARLRQRRERAVLPTPHCVLRTWPSGR